MTFRSTKSKKSKRAHGFTLIELLVVIAIIAILSVVVILTLNPTELLRSSRDSNRVADMQTLTTALGIFSEDQSSGSLGSANTVYVSIPDPTATSTLGDQCQGLGLPSLPSTYSYHCAASSTYRNINGNGWIPVNFSSISLGSPLGSLPIDPLNTSSTRNYYTYTTNGTQYEVTAPMESQKYKLGGSNDVVGPDGSTLSTVYAKGSNLSLEPLDYGDTSLVGLWSFNEGTGTVAYDYSGNNTNGFWNGTATGTSGYYSPGKIGSWAGAFDGTDNDVTIANSSNLSGYTSQTISVWVKAQPNMVQFARLIEKGANNEWTVTFNNVSGTINVQTLGSPSVLLTSSVLVADNTWHLITVTFTSGSFMKLYIDGQLNTSSNSPGTLGATNHNIYIGQYGGGGYFYNGLIDDVRIYNRALSASEIAAMYAGGK